MAKDQIVELVEKLKKAGINVSITKPRSESLAFLQQQVLPSN